MRKTAFVTGACINTGVAIVEKFAAEGYDVIFTGRSQAAVSAAEQSYRSQFPGVSVTGYVLQSLNNDGSIDVQGVLDLLTHLDAQKVSIDVLVLNAADQGLNMEIFKNPLEDFQRVINTNVIWNFCLCQAVAERMRDKGGSIIFINSNTAYRSIPDRIAYVTTKGAQLGMMRALALDLGKYNIRVNAVLPGMIKTNRWDLNPDFYANVPSRFTPLGDVAVGSDIADAVWYFAACARNTTGAELVVDGGNTIQLYPLIPENQ